VPSIIVGVRSCWCSSSPTWAAHWCRRDPLRDAAGSAAVAVPPRVAGFGLLLGFSTLGWTLWMIALFAILASTGRISSIRWWCTWRTS
jgi:hypothetical protein